MIQILSEEVINQIAAGEVVERPASIVKELIENSLDAGASCIEIAILDAGLKEIKVSDNGSGIAKDDFEKVFIRHATSKLSAIEDLQSLASLGFRGEALASIQAIAQVELESKLVNQSIGYGYSPAEQRYWPSNKSQSGTTITVGNLFYNLPARRKFVKSLTTETAHITRIIEQIALIHPQVGFRYTSQKREILKLEPTDSLTRLAEVLGITDLDYILALDSQAQDIQVQGFIGHPRLSKRSSQYHLFVNYRPVYQPLLMKAIQQGFDTMLEVGHYPLAFLSLRVPASQVDVNVHPRKTEVKFVDDKKIFQTVKSLVRQTLQQSAFEVILRPRDINFSASQFDRVTATGLAGQAQAVNPIQNSTWPKNLTANKAGFVSKSIGSESEYSFQKIQPNFRQLLEATTPKPDYLHIFDSYIIYPNQQGVMILDQHAVHEKVLLERLSNQPDKLTAQTLLFPLTYTVTASQKAFILENLSQLPAFEVDEFGKSEIIIRALPSFFATTERVEANIQSLIAMIEERAPSLDIQELRIELIKNIACKSAIKAGHTMSQIEIEALIRDAAQTDFGFACCHGRPTMVQLDQAWFEKQFSR